MPFLAPIFLARAREYTTKISGSGNGYRISGNKGGKSDAYKLSSISSNRKGGKGTFTSTAGTGFDTGSEENILQADPDGKIMKSVTYSVRVDDAKHDLP